MLTSVGGRLRIEANSALSSLQGLNMLASVGGRLEIKDNDALINLEGLDVLISTGEFFFIQNNDALINLEGLNMLTSIEGSFFISNNNALINLEGLDMLNSIGADFFVQNNDALINLRGFNNLNSIGRVLSIFGNVSLNNLEGMEMLTSIEGGLDIQNNDALINLEGLDMLTSVLGDLIIVDCDALISLEGLNMLTSIEGDFFIQNNNALISLEGLNMLTSIEGDFFIQNNNALISLEGLDMLASILGFLRIEYNPALSSLDGINSLTSLGFPWIAFNPNLSACSSAWLCNFINNLGAPNLPIFANAPGCNSTQEVLDNCGPSIEAICKNTTVSLGQGGLATITTDSVDGGSLGFVNINVSPSSFDCDNIGSNIVTLTVDDGSGNSDDCTATVTVQDGQGLPNSWSATSIGISATGNAYNFNACDGTTVEDEFTITGSGNNATSMMTDNVAFASQTLCGNGSITTKIESVGNTGYGGLMIRESSAAGSKMVAVYSNMSNSLRYESRTMDNMPKTVQSFFKPSPIWLRMRRDGMWIHVDYSSNGMTFSPVHSTMVSMQSCVKIGLASFTYLPNMPNSATFSNVSTTGNIQTSSSTPSTPGSLIAYHKTKKSEPLP